MPGSTEINGSGKPGAMEHAPRGKGMRGGDLVEGCGIGERGRREQIVTLLLTKFCPIKDVWPFLLKYPSDILCRQGNFFQGL